MFMCVQGPIFSVLLSTFILGMPIFPFRDENTVTLELQHILKDDSEHLDPLRTIIIRSILSQKEGTCSAAISFKGDMEVMFTCTS